MIRRHCEHNLSSRLGTGAFEWGPHSPHLRHPRLRAERPDDRDVQVYDAGGFFSNLSFCLENQTALKPLIRGKLLAKGRDGRSEEELEALCSAWSHLVQIKPEEFAETKPALYLMNKILAVLVFVFMFLYSPL